MGADIELHVVLEGSDAREPENVLKVTAAAIDKSGMRIPDGENWERAKIVRARMEKKEKDNRYVWQRWY